MKYAFIDYENIQSLDGLELKQYSRIFLFIGENQTNIRITERFNDELNITLITVKHITPNNLDFHIVYYLGKLDVTVDKNIEFHILSKDKGYDGICEFIKNKNEGRVCIRTGISNNEPKSLSEESEKEKVNQVFLEYKDFMAKREKKNLPARIVSLRNNIHNQTILNGKNKEEVNDIITKVINRLSSEKLLKITENKVNYP